MFRNFSISRACILGGALALVVLAPVARAAGGDTVLYEFTGGTDGNLPSGNLIADTAGNLYGTASFGGKKHCASNDNSVGCGVIFKVTPGGKESVLYTFAGGADGASPSGGLVMDSGGNFYGATAQGGTSEPHCGNGCGTVFKLTPSGTKTILYAFTSGSDGNGPVNGVIVDSAGNAYGTTVDGGTNAHCGTKSFGCGTVFKIASGGGETLLHVFTGGASDGAFPAGRLIADSAHNLYGTTGAGGSTSSCGTKWQGCGTVFKIGAHGKETILHVFTGGSDGAYPTGALVQDSGGNLYGTTVGGGSSKDCGLGPYGCGTVFKIASNGTETILYAFSGGSDGAYPLAAALFANNSGDLYGMTGVGGSKKTCGKIGLLPKKSGCGIVFKIAANGGETVLYAFKGDKASDGAYSGGGFIADGSGNLYGTTAGGGIAGCKSGIGTLGCGTVFKIKE